MGQGANFYFILFFSLDQGSPMISTLEMKALKIGNPTSMKIPWCQPSRLFHFQEVNDKAMNNLTFLTFKSSVCIRKLISLYSHACIRSNQQINLKKKKKTINYGKGKVKVEMNLVGRCFTYKYIFMDCLVILF